MKTSLFLGAAAFCFAGTAHATGGLTCKTAGPRPITLPNTNVSKERLLDSTTALEIARVPETLLVVGGGYIGLELGTVYAALGTEVSVVEMFDRLLMGADRDLVNVLAKRIKQITRQSTYSPYFSS